MGLADHRRSASASARVAVVTVSDTRTRANDEGGDLVAALATAAGHQVVSRSLCPDEPEQVRARVLEALSVAGAEAVIATGGTGFARRDATWRALTALYEVEIPGFGELFRALSYPEIGAAAMLSRASAGVVSGHPVFSLPGSVAACRLGMERLVLPELGHLLQQLRG